MEQLTVKEAKEQGYTHYGYQDMDNHPMKEIDGFDVEEIVLTPVLFSKEFVVPGLDVATLKELIGEHLWNQWDDKTSDDDAEALCREVKEMPDTIFESVVSEVNKEMLKYHKWYMLTDIKLIP